MVKLKPHEVNHFCTMMCLVFSRPKIERFASRLSYILPIFRPPNIVFALSHWQYLPAAAPPPQGSVFLSAFYRGTSGAEAAAHCISLRGSVRNCQPFLQHFPIPYSEMLCMSLAEYFLYQCPITYFRLGTLSVSQP